MKFKTLIASTFLALIFACNGPAPEPTPEAPVQYATGYKSELNDHFGAMHWSPKAFLAPIPDNFSWRANGCETPVRNQGQCGSCWAFASTQTLELAYKCLANKTIDFAERELVSQLFYGCHGGFGAGEYQVTKGMTDEASCSYGQSYDKKCPAPIKPVGKGSQWGYVGKSNRKPTVDEVKTAIMTYGSVWVTVCANSAYMNYKGGLSPKGPACGTNHMVTLIGWKTVNGKVYFEKKNSWGLNWGEKGYGWFELGSYNTGEDAGWIAIDALPCKPPILRLPKFYSIVSGDEVVLAVKKLPDVTYTWFEGDTELGTGNEVVVSPRVETVYKVVFRNKCGEGEIKTLVKVE